MPFSRWRSASSGRGSEKLLRDANLPVPDVSAAGAVVFVVRDNTYCGYLEVTDTVKPEAREAVAALKTRYHVVMRGQYVDHLSFPFVAPLEAQNHVCFHLFLVITKPQQDKEFFCYFFLDEKVTSFFIYFLLS